MGKKTALATQHEIEWMKLCNWDALSDPVAGSCSQQHTSFSLGASWFSEVPSGNKYAHTSWHREVRVGFCSTLVHYWELPLLASVRGADITQTEVVSLQVSEVSDLKFPLNRLLLKPKRFKALSISADVPQPQSCRFKAYNPPVEISWAACTLFCQ